MAIVRRWLHVVLGGCLLCEGASTVAWMASRVVMIPAYDAVTLVVIVARGLIGAAQLAAGSLVWRQSPVGLALAPVVLLASAVLYALELGARLRPSSVYPGARGILVVVYTLYAVTAAVIVMRLRPRQS
jgi:hypothetical protein